MARDGKEITPVIHMQTIHLHLPDLNGTQNYSVCRGLTVGLLTDFNILKMN